MTCRASSSLTGAHPQCHVIPKLRQFVKFLAVLSVCLQWPYLHSTECRGRCLWSRAPAVLRGPTGQTRRGNRAKRCHVGGPISPCPRELATHCKARKQGQRRRRQRGSVRVCHVIKLLTLSVNLSLIWHSCKLKPEIQAPLPFFKKKKSCPEETGERRDDEHAHDYTMQKQALWKILNTVLDTRGIIQNP